MSALIVLEKMVMLVLLMLVGFGCARAGWIDAAFSRKASKLVMSVFIVGMILSSVANVEPQLAGEELALALAAAFAGFLLSGAIGWLAARVLGFRGKDRDVAMLSVFFMNNMFIGFPVVEAVCGKEAVFSASLTNIPFNLLLYTVGVALLRAERGPFRPRDVLTAPLVATVLAIVLFLFEIPVPGLIADTLSTLGAATVPMSMVIVGISLSAVPMREALRDVRCYALSLVRLVVCPLVCWVVMGLILPEGTQTLGVYAIEMACPSAAMITILSVQFGADDRLASRINFLSTVLCAVTLPLVTWLVF